MDSLGLAAFTVLSGVKAINNQYNLLLFIFVTAITGVGGGVLRDIIICKKPAVFRKDIYCIAGVMGSLALWYLYPVAGESIAIYTSLIIVIVVRIISYIKDLHLPVIYSD